MSVNVGSATGKAGEQVSIPVTLHTAGIDVAGVQNDLSFTPGATPLVACVVNPDLGKNLSSIKISVAGLRAVIAGDNIDPIPDGSVLYTCTFTILDVTLGSYRLINSRVVAASPTGQRLEVSGSDGTIEIVGPRPTSTPTATFSPPPAPTPRGPLLALENVFAAPGDQVTITARLSTAGRLIAGTQNDISFSSHTPIAARADGTPDCAVNPDINKEATAFRFVIGGLRAIVLSFDNIDPIADGSVLYTCRVNVAEQARDGSYSLDVSNVLFSDPSGQLVPDVSGDSGTIFVRQPAATPTPVRPAVIVGSVQGNAGDRVTLAVTLHVTSEPIAGMQNDIVFDSAHAPIAAQASGKPNCAANPDINKEATAFNFLPNGCAGAACTTLRAIVLSYENTDAIPDGSILYTCEINIAPDAVEATYPLTLTNIVLSSPTGVRAPDAGGESGVVIVGGGGHIDHKPIPGVRPTPAATGVPGFPPALPIATPTATQTVAAAHAAEGTSFNEGDGGCQVGTIRGGQRAWLVLLGIGLIVARRRQRASRRSVGCAADRA